MLHYNEYIITNNITTQFIYLSYLWYNMVSLSIINDIKTLYVVPTPNSTYIQNATITYKICIYCQYTYIYYRINKYYNK